MPGLGSNLQALPLERLLAERADLWRGRSNAAAWDEGVRTGFAELDQLLPWHGWPVNGLTELLTDQPGIGLTLLLPALRRLCPVAEDGDHDHCDQPAQSDGIDLSISCSSQLPRPVVPKSRGGSWVGTRRQCQKGPQPAGRSAGWLLLVNPPYIPYAPALAANSLDLARVLVVEAPDQGAWVLEQALRSGGCTAVIGWSTADERRQQGGGWPTAILRRLQLAASEHAIPAFLLRPMASAAQSSPALLRLDVESAPDGLDVVLRKLRGGRAGLRLHLSGSNVPTRVGLKTKDKKAVDLSALRRVEVGSR